MKNEWWDKVERLYHAARELQQEERSRFLDEACRADPAMRRQIDALLQQDDEPEGLLNRPAVDLIATALSPGTTIGPYQVAGLIGAGGMGEVYRALDTRLKRDVAIKVLPLEFAHDRDRLRRFEQEARAAAALSHPNILAVYDIGTYGDIPYVVTELLEGETLRSRLNQSALDNNEAVDVATQVAAGLSAADARGIVHRDLKPENIFLTCDGHVKILDFGLAKIAPSSAATGDAVTLATKTGSVFGTIGYMAPEQVLGQPADPRSDIFAFGAILYEMVSGQRAFRGRSDAETILAILQNDPPFLIELGITLSSSLVRIIKRCLEKDPAKRFQSAADLKSDMARLRSESSAARRFTPKMIWAAVCAVVFIAIIAAMTFFGSRRSVAFDSLAVLPFVNENGDPDIEYLSDGITETLINNLSQLPGVKVVSQASVFSYKARDSQRGLPDPQEVARSLKVQAVLLGKVNQRGDSLSIGAELVDARDNSHMWGEQYNRKLADVFAIQDEISREISEKLRLKLTGDARQRLTKHYTDNTEAYRLYLKGRYHWNKRTEEGRKKALEYFEQAVKKDPNYALAYTGLADISYGQELPPKDAAEIRKSAAIKALQIDDTLPEGHTSLANILFQNYWDWPAAEKEFKRAISLNPGYATNHHWYAQFLAAMGRHQESLEESKLAQELDPFSLIINAGWAYRLYHARQYVEAVEQCHKTLELDSSFAVARWYLGLAYEAQGMYSQAISEFENALRLPGLFKHSMISSLGHAYAKAGRKGEAQKRIAELKELSKREYVAPLEVAIIHLGLGEKNRALEWLETAYWERNQNLIFLKVDPRFDDLRSDPRFRDLVRRVGLAP